MVKGFWEKIGSGQLTKFLYYFTGNKKYISQRIFKQSMLQLLSKFKNTDDRTEPVWS